MRKLSKTLALTTVLALSIWISSCNLGFDIVCENAVGEYVEYAYDLNKIEEIALSIDAQVYITQGDAQEVIVKGKEDAIEQLNFEVNAGLWDIKFLEKWMCLRNHELEIFITVQDLAAVKVSGSGHVSAYNDTIVVDETLELFISGSGSIDILTNAPSIDSRISGSGDLTMSGTADNLAAKISGSGNIHGFNLSAKNVDVNISGSGNAHTTVEGGLLNAGIAGSGTVYYRGNPGSLMLNITGSGQVIDAN